MLYPARYFFILEVVMNTKTQDSLRALVECSIMIALSTVLSVVPLFEMPYGGSITLASFLPVVVIAYRHGLAYGLGTAATTAVIQMLLGLKNFSYFTTWQSLVALAVFDYVLAFVVFGLAGIFRRVFKQQNLGMVAGAAMACVLRYICHVISGATIWAGLSIPTEAALIYSLSYNATYMVPETIILVLTAGYLSSALDFRTKNPTRIKSETLDTVSSWCIGGAGLLMLCALITDTVLVFSQLQNYNSGEFMILGLTAVNWLAVGIVTGVAIVIAAALIIYAKARNTVKS